jgi:Chaperone of endosialidase
MAIVLTTQLTLDPNNQLAHIADFTGLINTTEYVITGTYLQVDTRFTFHGFNDITLTKPPVGVPAPATQVTCQISTVPVPAPPPPPAKYPYGTKDRLIGGNLNLDLSSNPGTTPPSSGHGRATQGKLWLDTSVTPAQLRVCAVATAQVGYVAGDWFTLAKVAGGTDLGATYLPLTGGSISGPLSVAGALTASNTINGYTLGANGIVYPASGGHNIAFDWNGTLIARVDGTASPGALATVAQLGGYLPLAGGTITGSLTVNGNVTCVNTVQGANIVATANFAGPANYSFLGPGFGVATTITFQAGTTTLGGDLRVNGVGVFAQYITVGGLTLQNNAGYLYSPSNMRTTGLVVDGSIVVSNVLSVGGCQVSNNGGYFYSAQNMRTSGLVVDGQITGYGDVYGGIFRCPSVTGARIACYGGDWGFMTFAMSGGNAIFSPDNGSSGQFVPTSPASDARLKDNIRDTEIDALAAVLATPVRSFEWNDEGRKLMPYAEPVVPIGFVAQEVEQTMPDAVGTVALIGDTRHLIDQNFTPYVIRAIQQLAERVATLEAK